MYSICECRQTKIIYHEGESMNKRYDTHLVSGKTGRYFRETTLLVYDQQEAILFSCKNPSCNTVFHMRDHIEETAMTMTGQDYKEIWTKYSNALGACQSGCDLELLADFLKEFAKEQLVEFDKDQKGGKLLEARVPVQADQWGKAVDFVGNALMNSIREYDIRFITSDIKLKVVDGHLEMSVMAVFGEGSKI